MLIALIVCASYVSLVNDLTDEREDQASGKPSRWQKESRIYSVLLLVLSLAAGGGFLIVWRREPLVFWTYSLSWLSFTFYSVPPFRLKVRGAWGVLADASGAHLFPTVFAVILLCQWTGMEIPAKWIVIVALWSFAAGVRSILWHQMEDAASDSKIGLRTFACLHGAKATERLATLAFVVESLSFLAMLWLTRNAVAASVLAIYVLFAWVRWRTLGTHVAIVNPGQASRMALAEYYIALYPLAFLFTASWQQSSTLWLLLFHCLLFSGQIRRLAHDFVLMLVRHNSDPRPNSAVLHS